MEAWDAIRARRNVRQYTPKPVSEADLNRIAEAGWRAPSAKNRQAWDFVIVTDQAQLQELSTVWQGAGHIAGAAAAIAFVLPVPPSERRKVTDQYDVGQATMAMMIAATDLGIGTGHSSVGDQDKARAILGVPDGYEVAYLHGHRRSRRSPAQADPQTRTVARSTRSSITDAGKPHAAIRDHNGNNGINGSFRRGESRRTARWSGWR